MTGAGDQTGGRKIADMPGTFTDEFVVPMLREYTHRLKDSLEEQGAQNVRLFAFGDCNVIVCREPADKTGAILMWHMSVSCPDRHPTWDELKFLRYRLLPDDVCFAIFLPPSEFYVNVPSQDHVFHLWEVYDVREQWTGL